MPTMMSPPTTRLPNVKMMSPASACSRIWRVAAMFSDSRNSVVNSSSDGNVDSPSGELMYSDTISRITDRLRLSAISVSSTNGRSGRIINAITATMSNASNRSCCRSRMRQVELFIAATLVAMIFPV